MRSLDEHLAMVLALAEGAREQAAARTDTVSLAAAAGRVTARDHLALVPTPGFDNSAMDGFAVRATDLTGATPAKPVTLRVAGESAAAGRPAWSTVEKGTAIRVMTGAAIPDGADAVVAQEYVVAVTPRDGEGGGATFRAPVTLGAHIRRRGEDIDVGAVAVERGTVLGARHLAAAASAGWAQLEVRTRPRIAFLTTGDELVAPGGPLGPGQIHDSNAVYVAAALAAMGVDVIPLGQVGDEPDAVARCVAGAASRTDLIVTTGGASVGDHDPVKGALAPLGVDFTTVAMQPGKPQGIGTVEGTPVLCLPGNPVAVAVSTELLIGAFVRAFLGVPEPEWTPARAAESWKCPSGREQLMPVIFHGDAVRPATSGGSGSHLVARLANAEGLARVPADADAVAAGDTVLVRRFGG